MTKDFDDKLYPAPYTDSEPPYKSGDLVVLDMTAAILAIPTYVIGVDQEKMVFRVCDWITIGNKEIAELDRYLEFLGVSDECFVYISKAAVLVDNNIRLAGMMVNCQPDGTEATHITVSGSPVLYMPLLERVSDGKMLLCTYRLLAKATAEDILNTNLKYGTTEV